jgi:hypothetical protein
MSKVLAPLGAVASAAAAAFLMRDAAIADFVGTLSATQASAVAFAVAALSVTVAAVLAPLFAAEPPPPAKVERFPATAWKPTSEGRTRAQPALSAYPEYDAADPKGSFTRVCDLLIEETCAELAPCYEMPGDEVDWVREMLEYNVKGGKMNRGLMVVEVSRRVFVFTHACDS